jgi:transposase
MSEMVGRPSVTVSLSETDRNRLESWVRRRNTAHGPARRARIVLARAEVGATDSGVARSLEVSRMTVAVSRKRFVEHGVDGLLNKSGRGSPHRVTDAQIERAVVTTLEGAPPNATHWTTRSLAWAVGLSQSTVVRIWRAFAPRQHRRGTFRLSRDRLLIDKVRDVRRPARYRYTVQPPANGMI